MAPERSTALDLQGLLTVALVDAGPGEAAVVRRQLGPLAEVEAARPDVTIRFVDRVAGASAIRPLGPEFAVDDEGLLVLRGRRKIDVRVRLPVERIGEPGLEIVAERGLPAVPYLLPIVNLTLLAKGVAPIHASAFVADGLGVLVTGWAKGGKTEALLAFADHGATYVGDEWVFVTPDGGSMAGLPEPMRVWDWQIAMVPRLRARLGAGRRVRLSAAAAVARLLGGTSRAPIVRRTAVGDAARRAGALAENQRSLQVPPATVFDGRVATGLVPLDRVVLIESSGDAPASTAEIEGSLVARRTAATVAHELLDVQALYHVFRHAFPDRRNALIEDLPATLERRLLESLGGKRCVLVRHPHPPDIPALHGLIAGALEAVGPGGEAP